MEVGVARADAELAPCYLETDVQRNVGFYRRFGFDATGELDLVPDGPRHWAMWRPPRRA